MSGGALLLLWALAPAAGLRIDTSTPDALCPDVGQVRAAARARLGDIEGEGDWQASYALIHRPDGAEAGDVVRLVLRDPGGRLRLQRDLPRAGESCASLAQALVVILDGYFRHPSDPAEAALEPAEPGAAASPAAAAPAAGRPVRVVSAAPAAGTPGGHFSTDLSAGWAAGWGGAHRTSPLLALGLRMTIGTPAWWAGVEGSWLTAEQSQTVGGSTATLRSYGARAFVLYDLARDQLGAYAVGWLVGPELMLGLDHADAVMLPDGASRLRGSFGGGARTQLLVRLGRSVELSARVALDYLPASWGGTFLIAGSSPADGADSTATEIFPASRLRLTLGVGLNWVVF